MDTVTNPFQRLRRFLLEEMRMSHVYQPVMIRELLRRGGAASTEAIARALLAEDRAQVDYYRLIVRNMVGRVLTKNRGIVERDKDSYRLDRFEELTPKEVSELEAICDQRIASYLEKREDPWSHRRKSTGYVVRHPSLRDLEAGAIPLRTVRRLRRAQGARGGSHRAAQPWGFRRAAQSSGTLLLMQRHEAGPGRDRLPRHGRQLRERQDGCVFCQIPEERIVASNELCIAFRDLYPVTPLHTLIIPRRHVADYFGLFQPERNAVSQLLDQLA